MAVISVPACTGCGRTVPSGKSSDGESYCAIKWSDRNQQGHHGGQGCPQYSRWAQQARPVIPNSSSVDAGHSGAVRPGLRDGAAEQGVEVGADPLRVRALSAVLGVHRTPSYCATSVVIAYDSDPLWPPVVTVRA